MKPRGAPSPSQLARTARRLLRRAARHWPPRRATRFFKPWENVYAAGIDTSRLRAILRELYRLVSRAWGFAEARRFAELMLAQRSIEGRLLGIELLGRFHRAFAPALVKDAHRWLAADRCDNWALTDDLCGRVTAPFLRTHPREIAVVTRWARSPNLWVRRAAAVSLVPLARRGERLGAAYRVATLLLGDGEDLIHKATGWLLREAGRTDPARLEAYLLARGPRVPRTTLRYAIERFAPPRRHAILERTRAGRVGRARQARRRA
jgi:3-methyladenine DNA glycosylase AlkD